MEYLCTVLLVFLFKWSTIVPVSGIPRHYNSAQDTCVLSLVIPKESIKNNCDNYEALTAKIQSLEAQLRQMTHHVRVIDTQRIQPAMTQYADLASKVESMETQMSAMTLKNRFLESKYHEFESKLEILSRSGSKTTEDSDRLMDPIKPLLMQEFQILKANLMQSLEQELFHMYSRNFEDIGSATDMDENSENSSLRVLALKGDDSIFRNNDRESDELLEVESVNINQLARSLQKLTTSNNVETDESDKEVKAPQNDHSNVTVDTNSSQVSDAEQLGNMTAGIDLSKILKVSTDNTSSENDSSHELLPLGTSSSNTTQVLSQSNLSVQEKDQLTNEISQQLKVIIQRTIKAALRRQQEEVAMTTVVKDTEICSQCNFTAKISELEIKFLELKKNLTAISTNERASSLSDSLLVSQQVAELKAGLESLSRRVDGPQNTLQRASHLQKELDVLKTHIQVNLKEQLELSMTALQQRMTAQERNNNMSSSYLNIFKQTLQSYRNESQNMITNLQQNIETAQSQIKHLNKSRNQNSDIEMRLNELEADFGGFDFKQNAFDVKLDRIKDSMAQNDREVGTKFRSLQQNLLRIQSRFSVLTNLSRSVQIIGVKQATLAQKVSKNELTMKYLYIQNKLESGDWMEYNFSYNSVKNSCNKLQYVRQNSVCSGTTARFVGVILCSEDRYKILLGNSLDEEFLDIADEHGHGQDHCEFVGGTNEADAVVEKDFSFFPSQKAYLRAEWGEEPRLATISPILTPVTRWYECGVKIP